MMTNSLVVSKISEGIRQIIGAVNHHRLMDIALKKVSKRMSKIALIRFLFYPNKCHNYSLKSSL